MKMIALATALALMLPSVAAAQTPPAETFKEGIETRFVGANDKLSAFIGRVYRTSGKVTTTIWIFQRTPIRQGALTFNTAAAVADIDCAARTMKRTSVMQLHGEMFGADQASRVVSRQAVEEAPTGYAHGTLFALVIDQACATGPADDKKHPAFQTLTQARTYGFYASTR